MSDAPDQGDSPANDLQFDRAEYAAPVPTATCRVCGQALRDVYYQVNGQPFCPVCRDELRKALSGGSGFGRFVRATLLGSLAGILGAGIYYGVRRATNIEFGLISIVVGLMVGHAVKKGCNGRGGWFYQGLAMFLTYTAIMATYIPPTLEALREHKAAVAKPQKPAQPAAAAANREGPAKPVEADDDEDADADAGPPPSVAGVLVAIVMLIALAYAIPIIIGVHSPIGLIIIAVGLYEAWVINRRARIVVDGPYEIGPAPSGSDVHVEPAG